jgi:hypothetical protein
MSFENLVFGGFARLWHPMSPDLPKFCFFEKF